MNKKNSAVIRIVCWSVAAVALLAVLILGIVRGFSFWSGSFSLFGSGGFVYNNAGKYTAGAGEVKGDQVHGLEIDWLDGEILIEEYDGDTVKFSETASGNLKEKDQLHYYNDGGTLKIQYKKSEMKIISFGNHNYNKKLTVQIPKDTAEKLGDLNVDTISSDTNIHGITASNILLDSTSGNFTLLKCKAEQLSANSTSGSVKGEEFTVENHLEISTTSGDAHLQGSFGSLEYDTVSGDMTADCEVCPEKVTTDGVSGTVILKIPDNPGFTYRRDTVSGSFESDFEVKQKEGRGTYKNGEASFSFDTVSGDISIRKK